MKKLLFCLSFSLCLNVSLAQKQGFFNVYEQSEKSFCASAAIETEDDCMIIAVYDYYGGAGELKKISNNGDVLGRLPIGSEGVFSGIDGLYHDPFDSRSFYAIGHVTHWDRQITKPLVMHFSEDLDLLDWEEVDLPGEYRRRTAPHRHQHPRERRFQRLRQQQHRPQGVRLDARRREARPHLTHQGNHLQHLEQERHRNSIPPAGRAYNSQFVIHNS